MDKSRTSRIFNKVFVLAGLAFFSHILLLYINKELYGESFLFHTFVNYTILLVFIILGLLICRNIAFQLPFSKHGYDKFRYVLLISTAAGILLGILSFTIILLSPTYISHLKVTAVEDPSIMILILASIQAGINEEIAFRLFGLSLIIWIFMKIFKRQMASSPLIIPSIILVGLLFAVAHLLNLPQNVNISIIYISIFSNLVGGFLYGILFWKKGLESAMIAHIFADITLQMMLFFYL